MPSIDNNLLTRFQLGNVNKRLAEDQRSIVDSSKRKFETKYKDYFKNKPHALAMLSYDLIGLISKINSFDSMFKHEMLFYDEGFIGITSWFKFNRNGKVLRKPFIYHIKNQKFKIIN